MVPRHVLQLLREVVELVAQCRLQIDVGVPEEIGPPERVRLRLVREVSQVVQQLPDEDVHGGVGERQAALVHCHTQLPQLLVRIGTQSAQLEIFLLGQKIRLCVLVRNPVVPSRRCGAVTPVLRHGPLQAGHTCRQKLLGVVLSHERARDSSERVDTTAGLIQDAGVQGGRAAGPLHVQCEAIRVPNTLLG
eukprot:1172720-Prorocentrum_minimum.AAC.1